MKVVTLEDNDSDDSDADVDDDKVDVEEYEKDFALGADGMLTEEIPVIFAIDLSNLCKT